MIYQRGSSLIRVVLHSGKYSNVLSALRVQFVTIQRKRNSLRNHSQFIYNQVWYLHSDIFIVCLADGPNFGKI
jgi:hypothetical protein